MKRALLLTLGLAYLMCLARALAVPPEQDVVCISITVTNQAQLEPTYQIVLKGRPNVALGEWQEIIVVPEVQTALTNIVIPRTNIVSLFIQAWERDPVTGREVGPFDGSARITRALTTNGWSMSISIP